MDKKPKTNEVVQTIEEHVARTVMDDDFCQVVSLWYHHNEDQIVFGLVFRFL